MNQAPILQMQTIKKRFPGVQALKGVELEVSAGEVVALIGENGAGKSTLMNIIGGVHQPDGGRILIDNTPVVIRSVADAIKHGIAFIHQELNVLENLDVAANVFLGREPWRAGFLPLVDSRKIHEETRTILMRLGLEISTHTSVAKLSLAEQQLVEIAKALSLDARILIMDEPTSSLTLAETARLLQLISELRAQGVAVIFVSHRLGEVREIADRAVVLRDGTNAGALAREEITHDRMVSLMVGRDLNHFYQRPKGKVAPRYFAIEKLCTARYPEKPITFAVGQGEIFGMAGLVGAGRSEVAQAIFGIDPAVEIRLRLDDRPLRIRSPKDALKHGVYLVPEDRRRAGLITAQLVRENITLPALRRCAKASLIAFDQERQHASEMCRKLKIKAPSIETKAGNLSGGNQQKLVLAKWLALAPKVMIFDEPTRGIDVGAKAEIYSLMRELAEAGVAIIMISSDLEEVLGISDRVAVMREGSITGILERSECSEQAIMHLAVDVAELN
jgi:ribose transport system ATP-binding protein